MDHKTGHSAKEEGMTRKDGPAHLRVRKVFRSAKSSRTEPRRLARQVAPRRMRGSVLSVRKFESNSLT